MVVLLSKLQEEQALWSARNFGDQSSEMALLGLVEEVGELAHAVLKREQGIRTNEKLDAKLKDAIGDIVIYAADYATRENISLVRSFETLAHMQDMMNFRDDADTKALVFTISLSVGRLCKYHSSRKTLNKDQLITIKSGYLGALLVQLKRLTEHEKLQFNKVVKDTWAIVQKRDWKKYKKTGTA